MALEARPLHAPRRAAQGRRSVARKEWPHMDLPWARRGWDRGMLGGGDACGCLAERGADHCARGAACAGARKIRRSIYSAHARSTYARAGRWHCAAQRETLTILLDFYAELGTAASPLTPHRASGYASTAAIMRENLNRNAHARGENVARRQATIPSRRLGESRRPAAHRPRGQGDLAPARPRRDSHDPRNHGQSGRGNEAPAGGCGQHRRSRVWQARPGNQWPRRGTAERRAGSLTGDR